MHSWMRTGHRPTTGCRFSVDRVSHNTIRPRGSRRWHGSIGTPRATGDLSPPALCWPARTARSSIASTARHAGLRVFELNVGAPHASEATPGAIAQETDPVRLGELVARVRAATEGMQLWVKLTGLSANLPALAVAASRAGADAVCMMGRFMAMVPDIDTLAPVLGTSGAYGGAWALPIVCRFLALSRRAVEPGFPLLAPTGCGQAPMLHAWRSRVLRHASCCRWLCTRDSAG